jgi:hypothetical protein
MSSESSDFQRDMGLHAAGRCSTMRPFTTCGWFLTILALACRRLWLCNVRLEEIIQAIASKASYRGKVRIIENKQPAYGTSSCALIEGILRCRVLRGKSLRTTVSPFDRSSPNNALRKYANNTRCVHALNRGRKCLDEVRNKLMEMHTGLVQKGKKRSRARETNRKSSEYLRTGCAVVGYKPLQA